MEELLIFSYAIIRKVHDIGGCRTLIPTRVSNGFGFWIEPVRLCSEHLAAEIDRGPMRQVFAMGKRHVENGIARVELRQVHRCICLGARMRQDVGAVSAEECVSTLDSKPLDKIDELAATAISFCG
jgi:hypothetical protein